MKLKVENDIVRKNVELFKVLLKKSCQQTTLNKDLEGKIYQAFIHKVNGELRFNDVSPEITGKELSLWRPITLRVLTHRGSPEKIECEVIEKQMIPSEGGVGAEAFKILEETLKTIQIIARLLPNVQSLPRLFMEFSQVHLEVLEAKRRYSDLIHEAWHQLDRLQTEAFLQEKDRGSFLFRKDEYAAILEEGLTKAHDRTIKCITLSYLDKEGKVCDLTLVKNSLGWLVYNDDPNLTEPIYPDIEAFLDNMKGILSAPMIHSLHGRLSSGRR